MTIDCSEKNELDRENAIQSSVNPILQEKECDETTSHREVSLTVSHDAKCSPVGERRSLETEQSEILGTTKTELTLHYLKTSAAECRNGGLRINSHPDTFTPSVVSNNCNNSESSGFNSVDLISKFKSRTISATSDSDYYDLDDDEVERSIQKEEHWNSANTGDSLFANDHEIPVSLSIKQILERPLPEITEPLDILMENELYTSL